MNIFLVLYTYVVHRYTLRLIWEVLPLLGSARHPPKKEEAVQVRLKFKKD
jgi:hypothetical protein